VTAIRKHFKDFLAIVGLVIVAAIVSAFILGHQRLTLPWQHFYDVNAEMSTAQAVTPGQGQTVDIAGVEVGQISSVKLVNGRAIIGLQIKEQYAPIYRDATVLLRPKTGLKDMVAELTPGAPQAGKLPDGGTIPVSNTLPDVNLDEILSSLDADTRDYLRLLLSDAGQALAGNDQNLAQTLRRIEPTAKYARQINEALATRASNIRRVVHNFSLLMDELGHRDNQVAAFVTSSNAVFATLASQDAAIRQTLVELPGTLNVAQSTLGKTKTLADILGPTAQSLLPGARALGPSLVETRPFLNKTTPVIRDRLRPFARASLPTVKELRPALTNLSDASPHLNTTFDVLNALLNTVAYNPPGKTEEGYLFWQSWLNHLAPTVFSQQDAHGPIRHGVVILSCNTAQTLNVVTQTNPLLSTLIQLLNAPSTDQICPKSTQAPGTGTG
jgi:phospholipid/cholesterol/gamma-HCH transport system substrate-binding protein